MHSAYLEDAFHPKWNEEERAALCRHDRDALRIAVTPPGNYGSGNQFKKMVLGDKPHFGRPIPEHHVNHADDSPPYYTHMVPSSRDTGVGKGTFTGMLLELSWKTTDPHYVSLKTDVLVVETPGKTAPESGDIHLYPETHNSDVHTPSGSCHCPKRHHPTSQNGPWAAPRQNMGRPSLNDQQSPKGLDTSRTQSSSMAQHDADSLQGFFQSNPNAYMQPGVFGKQPGGKHALPDYQIRSMLLGQQTTSTFRWNAREAIPSPKIPPPARSVNQDPHR